VMASFVRFLVERSGEPALRRFLGSARPGALDAAATEVYGATLAGLDAEWRSRLNERRGAVSMPSFLQTSLRYLRPHWKRQAEIFVYMLLGLSFTLVFPFVTRELVDNSIPSGDLGLIGSQLGLLGGVLAVSLLASLRRAYVSAYVSGSVIRDIRGDMFGSLQSLDAGWYQRHPQGDLLSRLFSDVGQVENGLSQTLREGTFQVLTLVISAGVMLTLNPLLGVIVLVCAPFVGLVYRFMGGGARERSIAVQEQTSGLFRVASENLDAQQLVKAYSLGEFERGRFRSASDRLFAAQRRLVLYTGLFGLSVNLIVTALRLGVLGVGAWLIVEGRMTIGALVAFLGIMGEVINPVTALTSIAQEVQQTSGALHRVNEVVHARPRIAPAAAADRRVDDVTSGVALRGVRFGYDPSHLVLDGVDVSIPAGSRVAFVGPSGSGKSTVLRLLLRQYDPDEGAVEVDGVDLRDVDVEGWRRLTGVVFQDNFLFDTSLLENIRMGRLDASDDEVLAAARAAEVDAFVDRLPEGYASRVGEGGSLLSGGQRQRVAIARALLRQPRLLLLDEATSALDPGTERRITETLDRVSQGRTTVAITHRLASIADYDKIVVLVEGRVSAAGPHDQLLAQGGVYAELWAEQMGGRPGLSAADVALALSRSDWFRDAGPDLIDALAAAASVRSAAPGERIVGAPGEVLVVAAGRAVVVEEDRSGVELRSGTLRPGDVRGLDGGPGLAARAFEAVDPLTVVVLGADDVARAAGQDAALGARLRPHDGRVRPVAGSVVRPSLVLTGAGASGARAPDRPAIPTGG
jgi:ABC-type multidrug transport system fused ATPase/permease subunit